MELKIPPPELVPYILRAMKVVSLVDGTFAEQERSVLGAASRLYGVEVDIDALEPIDPRELAAKLTDPQLRQQLIHGLIVLSMIDSEGGPEEAEAVQKFAKELGVNDAMLSTLCKLADGNMLQVRFDFARRLWMREKLKEEWEQKGFTWLLKTAAALAAVENKALAERYRALEAYPRESLGYAYFRFIRSNQFSLPGERGAPPQSVVIHDCTHVLSGYETTPSGEVQTAAFHAGYRREDPFVFIFFVLLQFQMGVQFTSVAKAEIGFLDPEKVLVPLQRGAAMNIDLTKSWDPWSVFDQPLEELRQRYNIFPLA